MKEMEKYEIKTPRKTLAYCMGLSSLVATLVSTSNYIVINNYEPVDSTGIFSILANLLVGLSVSAYFLYKGKE